MIMIYWYHRPNYWDFLAFSEKVNLQIMEQLESEGIEFAAPALTVHTGARDGRGPRAGYREAARAKRAVSGPGVPVSS